MTGRMTNPVATPLPTGEALDYPSPVTDISAGRGPAWLDAFLAANLSDLITFRRDIHRHPEIAFQEHRTTSRLIRELEAWGIEGTVLPTGTGLTAQVGNAAASEDVIALRADIDALPLQEESNLSFTSVNEGIAHACGHDIHTAVLLGTLLALASAPELASPVRGIFQPAEEVMPGGAHDVVAANALAGVSRAYALHCDPSLPVGKIGLRTGPITSACDLIDITVTGPGGHTSRPQGHSDLVGALAAVVDALPERIASEFSAADRPVMAWGAIHAGQAANVLPRSGTLRGTLRLAERGAWDRSESVITAAVHDILGPLAVQYRLDYVRGVPPVVNDAAAVADLHTAVSVGLGDHAIAQSPQSSGGEDFAIMLDHVPGALARLGVWDEADEQVDLHSSSFVADERAIPIGIRTLVHSVLVAGDISGK